MAGTLTDRNYRHNLQLAEPAFGHDEGWLIYRHCEPTGRAKARPMTGSAKQSRAKKEVWIASSLRSSQ
jgi:hypothetical protein